MDFSFRCNALNCRAKLVDQAVVTSCSHVFCIACSESLEVSSVSAQQAKCPACHTLLVRPDDAITTSLHPPEEYKSTVLSGFSPRVIMECVTRGIAFWSYQANQEIIYQEYLVKSLTDKCDQLNSQVEKVVKDANMEIDSLNKRISQLSVDHETLKSDNTTLAQALREKTKSHQQIQEKYETMKQKELATATRVRAHSPIEQSGSMNMQNVGSKRRQRSVTNEFLTEDTYNHLVRPQPTFHLRRAEREFSVPISNFNRNLLLGNIRDAQIGAHPSHFVKSVDPGNYPAVAPKLSGSPEQAFQRSALQSSNIRARHNQHSDGGSFGLSAGVRRGALFGQGSASSFP